MHDKAIDRNISMVIFLTAVLLAGIVTAGRDTSAGETIRETIANEIHALVGK